MNAATGLSAMIVTKVERQWWVTDGDTLIGPFPSSRAAWAWLERFDVEHAVDRNNAKDR